MAKVKPHGASAPARPLSLADEASHVSARVGINLEMREDPFVEALFCRWAWPTGIRTSAAELAALPQKELLAQLEAGALERMIGTHRDRFHREARTLVSVHMPRLTWAFVPTDLVEQFECEVLDEILAAAFKGEAQAVREFQVTDQPPEIDVPLNATVEQFLSRLTAAARLPAVRRGRMPKSHGAALEQGARWLYRVWVRGEKPEAIAREYTEARRQAVSIADRNASTVLARIGRAQWALGLPVRVRNS